MAKQNIYDNDRFYEYFKNQRMNDINFNDVVETPIINQMLPPLEGKHI